MDKNTKLNILKDCGIDTDRLWEEKPLLVSNILKAMDRYYNVRVKKDEMINVLRWIGESPDTIDSATVPKRGISVAPEQVVTNISLGYVVWDKLLKLVKKFGPLSLGETRELSEKFINDYKNNN